jgi:uncharacterized protein (DUF1499 family)
MAASVTVGSGSRSLASRAAELAVVLTALSVLLIALGPIGWRAGWWHFRFAFNTLMPSSAYLAVAGLVVSISTLLLLRSSVGRGGTRAAIGALIVSAALVYVPWQWTHLRATAPPLHDITTDTQDPPAFAAVLQARRAEDGNTVVYDPNNAVLQKQGYPDLAPVMTSLPPPAAFKRALDTATEMGGWRIVLSDPAAGRIEASQSSRFFGFTDDIVIRVAAAGAGSRIDMRSEARQGRSDYGVNAARVRTYMDALRHAVG